MKFLLPVLGLCCLSHSVRADWPTYLHDVSRVGHTQQGLKAPLRAGWSFASPVAPELAWPGEDGRVIEGMELKNRIRFDDVFHTAIAGGKVYFGSSVDGRVYCYELATGKELWARFTDGPIRLAPMVAEGRVYVGSDDGYAYCLDAATGAEVWRMRAGPDDERVLARGRMISRWPIRTGVLVDDGVAFFGAGVFPHEKVFVYALDAVTGALIWKNDTVSQEDAGRNDLSPQGYLLASKELLFVPSGRALAMAFDRKTGKPVNKPTPGWRSDAGGQIGGSQAMLLEDQILAVGEHQVLALDQKTGKAGYAWFRGTQMTFSGEVGYMANGKQIVAIDRDAHAKSTQERHAIEMKANKLNSDLRKHPALAELKKVTAAEKDLNAAQAAGAGVEEAQATLVKFAQAYEPLRVEYQVQKEKLADYRSQLENFQEAGIKWVQPIAHESAMILAGENLVVGGDKEVLCLNAGSGEVTWKTAVEGEARGLAVADGYLVVSTTAGKVYSFAAADVVAGAPLADQKAKTEAPFPVDDQSALYAAAAEEALARSGVKEGFCLVIGNEQGRLAYEIAKRSNLMVYGLEADAEKVRVARERLIKTGLYGSRIIVDHLDLDVIPHASYFANLIVSDHLLLTGKMPGLPQEVARTLKPIGGVLCLGMPEQAEVGLRTQATANVAQWLAETGLKEEGAEIKQAGSWNLLTRAALPGADSWSHQYGNAANTSSNRDERVKGGLSVLWYGDPGPGKMVNRHAGAVGPISTNGRLFVQGETTVMAYDAFNGRFLWEVENPGAIREGLKAAYEPGNMAASDDALFVAIEDHCNQFDAATGEVVHRFSLPPEDAGADKTWGYVAYEDGVLYGAVTDRKELAAVRARRTRAAAQASDSIFAYDVASKNMLWRYQGQSISHVTIAIGDGRVFFVDSSLTPEQRDEMLKQDKTELAKLTGKERELAEDRIKTADRRMAVAVDAKTGVKAWAKPVDVTDCSEIGIGGGSLTLIYHNGHLVLGGANANGHYWEQFLGGEFERRRLVVLDAEKGEKLWAKDANYKSRPIVINNEIIAEPWGFDLYTGAPKTRAHPLTGEETPWMFSRPGHHCGAISATSNLMFYRSKTTAFYNLDADEGTEHFGGQRLGCWINTIPANGLVMVPEASAGCVCLFSIASTIVFEPREQSRMKWGVYGATGSSKPVRHMALNFGAPGDRRDGTGKLWLGYPRPSSRAGLDLPLSLKQTFAAGGEFFHVNEETVEVAGAAADWIYASGALGLARAEVPLLDAGEKPASYQVRLYFAAAAGDQPGKRVFDIKLQGETVRAGVDVVVKAGAAQTEWVERFDNIAVSENLVLELVPADEKAGLPILNGIEVLRSGEIEIRIGALTR
jgi:outer membrane protein assembly factor BamB